METTMKEKRFVEVRLDSSLWDRMLGFGDMYDVVTDAILTDAILNESRWVISPPKRFIEFAKKLANSSKPFIELDYWYSCAEESEFITYDYANCFESDRWLMVEFEGLGQALCRCHRGSKHESFFNSFAQCYFDYDTPKYELLVYRFYNP